MPSRMARADVDADTQMHLLRLPNGSALQVGTRNALYGAKVELAPGVARILRRRLLTGSDGTVERDFRQTTLAAGSSVHLRERAVSARSRQTTEVHPCPAPRSRPY